MNYDWQNKPRNPYSCFELFYAVKLNIYCFNAYKNDPPYLTNAPPPQFENDIYICFNPCLHYLVLRRQCL